MQFPACSPPTHSLSRRSTAYWRGSVTDRDLLAPPFRLKSLPRLMRTIHTRRPGEVEGGAVTGLSVYVRLRGMAVPEILGPAKRFA